MTEARDIVALVRGEALNPFELAGWRHVERYKVVAIGRRGALQHEDIGLAVRECRALGQVLPGLTALSRRPPGRLRLPEATELTGLGKATQDARVLHGAETFIAWSAQLARLRLSRPSTRLVLTCWETIPFAREESQRISQRKAFVRGIADLLLATTERARDALLVEGVDSDRIAVLPPAITAPRELPAARPERAQVEVLVPGRVIQEKGGLELLLAVARLPPRHRARVHLTFVGSGPGVERLRAGAGVLSLEGQLTFAGQMPHNEMRRAYAAADVVAVPSLSTPYWEEQYGMVLIEAFAAGRPVLTTTSGAIPEVVGECALVVPMYDVDALSEGLLRLVEDGELRHTLASSGHRRVLQQNDPVEIGRRLSACYDRVLD